MLIFNYYVLGPRILLSLSSYAAMSKVGCKSVESRPKSCFSCSFLPFFLFDTHSSGKKVPHSAGTRLCSPRDQESGAEVGLGSDACRRKRGREGARGLAENFMNFSSHTREPESPFAILPPASRPGMELSPSPSLFLLEPCHHSSTDPRRGRGKGGRGRRNGVSNFLSPFQLSSSSLLSSPWHGG